MKKIIALVTMMVMCLSVTVGYADSSVEDKFLDAMSTHLTYGNIKMNLQMSADGAIFDYMGEEGDYIKSVLGSSYNYDINALSNEEATEMSADGRISFISGMEELVPSFDWDFWLSLDIVNAESMQYFIVLKEASEALANELGEEYLLLDYMKIPGFKEVIKSLAETGAFKAESQELSAIYSRMLEGVELNPIYKNGKYTLTMGDKAAKNMIVVFIGNLLDMAAEMSGEEGLVEEAEEIKNELAEVFAPFANIQLFDDEKGIVMELEVDDNNDCTAMHMEVNLDMNIYDFAKVFDPESEPDDGSTREDYALTFSVVADAEVFPLDKEYKVEFPKLDNSNSVDIFAISGEAFSFAIIGEAEDNIQIVYNGVAQEFTDKPMIIYDRTFVPFRALANMFGVGDDCISYDEATEKVYLKSGETEIEMHIGSTAAYVNGEMKVLDVPAFTYNDRTYIPVRFVSEMFGRSVGYEQTDELQKITIND